MESHPHESGPFKGLTRLLQPSPALLRRGISASFCSISSPTAADGVLPLNGELRPFHEFSDQSQIDGGQDYGRDTDGGTRTCAARIRVFDVVWRAMCS